MQLLTATLRMKILLDFYKNAPYSGITSFFASNGNNNILITCFLGNLSWNIAAAEMCPFHTVLPDVDLCAFKDLHNNFRTKYCNNYHTEDQCVPYNVHFYKKILRKEASHLKLTILNAYIGLSVKRSELYTLNT